MRVWMSVPTGMVLVMSGDDPTSAVHHAIDHVEIAVDDVGAAKAFYGAAFGWEFTDYSRSGWIRVIGSSVRNP